MYKGAVVEGTTWEFGNSSKGKMRFLMVSPFHVLRLCCVKRSTRHANLVRVSFLMLLIQRRFLVTYPSYRFFKYNCCGGCWQQIKCRLASCHTFKSSQLHPFAKVVGEFLGFQHVELKACSRSMYACHLMDDPAFLLALLARKTTHNTDIYIYI